MPAQVTTFWRYCGICRHVTRSRHGALVGYSLGGSMTLALMGQQQHEAPVFAAVAVSVPLQLQQCADRMSSGFSRLYCRHFMSELTAYWQDKAQHLEQLGRADAASAVRACLAQGPFRSFWHYDDALGRHPCMAIRMYTHYYRRASPASVPVPHCPANAAHPVRG
jgi:predicted alpha/beta-fold hydrolase